MTDLAKTPQLNHLLAGFGNIGITNKQKSTIIAENFGDNVEASSFSAYFDTLAKIDEYDLRGRAKRLVESGNITQDIADTLSEFCESQYSDIFLLENYKKFVDKVSWDATFKKEGEEFTTFFEESMPHVLVAKAMMILESSPDFVFFKRAYEKLVTCFSLPAKFVRGYVISNLQEHAMQHDAIHQLVEGMKTINPNGLTSVVSYMDSSKGSVSTIKTPMEYAAGGGFSFMAEGKIYTWDGANNVTPYNRGRSEFVSVCESFAAAVPTAKGVKFETPFGNVIRLERIDESIDFVERDVVSLSEGQLFSVDGENILRVDKVYEGKSYIMSNGEVYEGVVKVPNFTYANILRLTGDKRVARDIYENNKLVEFTEKYGKITPVVQLKVDEKAVEVHNVQDIVESLGNYNVSVETIGHIVTLFENLHTITELPGAFRVSDGYNTSIFMKVNESVSFHAQLSNGDLEFSDISDPEFVFEHYDAFGINLRAEFKDYVNEKAASTKRKEVQIFELKGQIKEIDDAITLVNENTEIANDKAIRIHKRDLMNEKMRLVALLEEMDGSDETVDAIQKWVFSKDDQEAMELAENMGIEVKDEDDVKKLIWNKFENKTNEEIIKLAKENGFEQ